MIPGKPLLVYSEYYKSITLSLSRYTLYLPSTETIVHTTMKLYVCRLVFSMHAGETDQGTMCGVWNANWTVYG